MNRPRDLIKNFFNTLEEHPWVALILYLILETFLLIVFGWVAWALASLIIALLLYLLWQVVGQPGDDRPLGLGYLTLGLITLTAFLVILSNIEKLFSSIPITPTLPALTLIAPTPLDTPGPTPVASLASVFVESEIQADGTVKN